ncbi:hybrid-cluster NAD(P)-dependent oxidoreductase [Vibrio nitrifigilis]|uniref:Hybrid-cluster NAD(P)-dependent oxidoreductase n=1 Tax=Vibrio nitrifigilis TaxID=2789781 RepID=A0ABS0GLT5_9VIBR|nr:hybrid-cluster NAD(P)-dependent oxidoreductase [Vibrio nitrifigilis]MBF9003184.1 hybrid-cluster NAD(P)-dependent oxidoreductase [Vibrio nitrifigilis]
MSLATLAQINVYPVKSLGGVSLSQAWVEFQGLTFDRRFMVATPSGEMITARKYPQMVKVTSVLTPEGLIFSAPDQAPLTLRYRDMVREEVAATVWKDSFSAYTTTSEADQWFSDLLGITVTLLFTGEQSNRHREKVGHNVSFADGYPVLVISQESLDELNKRSSESHVMDQFRTNLVVSGAEPFVEDTWKRIRIGEVEFESVKPCQRCILTTVDVATGDFRTSKEPLKTLAKFRADETGGVYFGQNLVAKNEGIISVDDPIEVLEYKTEPEYYADNGQVNFRLTCVDREEMARDFVTLWFEIGGEFAPDYLPEQYLPIEVQIDGQSLVRYYTLSSSPSRPGRLAISVKRVGGGKVSNWLVDHVHVGDRLIGQAPDGQFHLKIEQSHEPMLLLSAGSGVTPMLSILRFLADNNQLSDVVFYHQCRSEEDIPCREELEQLNHQFPGLSVRLCLTQPPVDWFGLKGRLSLSHIKQIPEITRRQVFVCGPDGFMQKAKNLILKQGVPEESYHQESFGIQIEADEPLAEISLEVNGTVFKGNNQDTLLEQAEKEGVAIAHSCRAGFCGACRVKVKSGDVSQPDVPALTAKEREQGFALACCCIPKTNITIESE